MRHLRNLLSRRRGATIVEYMVMFILASLIIMAGIRVFGPTVEHKFSDANEELSDEVSQEGPGRKIGTRAEQRRARAEARRGRGVGGEEAGGEQRGAGGGAARLSGAASPGHAAGTERGGGSGERPVIVDSDESQRGAAISGHARGDAEEEEASVRINPVVLLISAALLTLLLYVRGSGKES